MKQSFDVVVVGAGYIGCSIAYYLTKRGLQVAVVEQSRVAGGASGANYGNIQVQDAELEFSLPLTLAGRDRYPGVEEELGVDLMYRELGSLLLIETPEQWAMMEHRVERLRQANINAELIQPEEARRIEALLEPSALLGACYHSDEGQIDPFRLLWGFLRRALERGLSLHTQTQVTGIQRAGGKLTGLRTDRGDFSTDTVVLATGAWTRNFGRELNQTWPIQHVRGQALATERSRSQMQSHLSSASFFEDTGQSGQQPGLAAILAVAQSGHGNFLLGEAAEVTTRLNRETTRDSAAAIANEVSHFMPDLQKMKALRLWAAPVAFTRDGLPLLGAVEEPAGLYLATAFRSTVVVTPIAGEIVADMIMGWEPDIDVSAFSPNRLVPAGEPP